MRFLERYTGGEYEQVWAELTALGDQVRKEPVYSDTIAVAQETMLRVRSNIEQLVPRLESIGYQFGVLEDGHKLEWQSQPPLKTPTSDATEDISRIEAAAGPTPLSLRAFYEIVGSIDFCGHHPKWAGQFGPMDPIVVEGPSRYPDWAEYTLQNIDEQMGFDKHAEPYIEIAPDMLHKDNISGGAPYAIAVPCFAADGPVLNIDPRVAGYAQGQEPLFVDYLRICLNWGGFPVFADLPEGDRPAEDIAFLTRNLIPF